MPTLDYLRRTVYVRGVLGVLARSVRWNSTGKLEENSVKATIPGRLYEQWPKLKPHLPHILPRDVTIELPYVRLRSNGSSSAEDAESSANLLRIVALHGSPGSAADFNALAQALGQKASVDFVAPTFPDFHSTLKNRVFWHSAEEKLALTEALLEKIGIKEIDVAVGHSAGSYSAMMMCLYADKIKAKSVVLIGSTGFRILPVNQPEWLLNILVRCLWIKPLERLVFAIIEMSLKTVNLGKMTAYEAISSIVAQYSTIYWGSDRGLLWCSELEKHGVPRSVISGFKDKLVPEKYTRWILEDIGNPEEKNHFIYEGKSQEELTLVNKPLPNKLPEVVTFRQGGDFVFQQYPDVVAQHILDFARRVLHKV